MYLWEQGVPAPPVPVDAVADAATRRAAAALTSNKRMAVAGATGTSLRFAADAGAAALAQSSSLLSNLTTLRAPVRRPAKTCSQTA